MSSGQMPHHYPYSQPRHSRVPSQPLHSQLPPHHNPYSNTDTGYHSLPISSRQPNIGSGFRFPYSMPGYSSLTNSALVDALLIPDTDQQEQERREFSLAASSYEPPSKMKRSRPTNHRSPPPSDSGDEDSTHGARRRNTALTRARPRKQQKRKSTAPVVSDDDNVDEDLSDDLNTSHSVRKPRRSNRAKRSRARPHSDDPDEYDSSPPQKVVKPKKATPAKRAKKERPGRLIRKKPIGTPVPKTLAEAGPPDRMMWQWKNQGKNWEEIRVEWKRLTGVEPGSSSLSVRYIKLVENLARNGAAGDLELLRFKREAEEELLAQLWVRVAEKMLTYSTDSEHNPKDLQKRYNMIVRSGYDVEKLLADEEQQREAEQTHQTSLHGDGGNGEDFEMEFSGITAYDDPVANETAASLKDKATKSAHINHTGTGYEDELPSVSANPADLFHPCDILQNEVNGSNERRHHHNTEYGIPTREPRGSLMHGATQPPTTFAAQKRELDNSAGNHLPFTSSLVGYSSDSE